MKENDDVKVGRYIWKIWRAGCLRAWPIVTRRPVWSSEVSHNTCVSLRGSRRVYRVSTFSGATVQECAHLAADSSDFPLSYVGQLPVIETSFSCSVYPSSPLSRNLLEKYRGRALQLSRSYTILGGSVSLRLESRYFHGEVEATVSDVLQLFKVSFSKLVRSGRLYRLAFPPFSRVRLFRTFRFVCRTSGFEQSCLSKVSVFILNIRLL